MDTSVNQKSVQTAGAAAAAGSSLPPRNAATYRTLFITCMIVSATTFGGGMVIMAVLQRKFVEELKWLSEEEIMDMIAIAQSCPGVMAVNTSIIIGYRIGGVPGALMTVFGTILPPMVILSILSVFYTQFRQNRIVALVFRGMQAGVVAVVLSAMITMAKNVIKNRDVTTIPMLAAACIAAVYFQVDVIYLILFCGVFGGIAAWLRMKKTDKGQKEGTEA